MYFVLYRFLFTSMFGSMSYMLCTRNVFGFRRRNVRVPTVLSFVAPLHVLSITKNHVSLEGVTFRQNAKRRLDVKHVQLLSNVNEETFIAVVNMYVGFVKNMCCLTICATCNLKRLRHQVTNLFFTTLRLNSSLRGTML